jgi:5'-3' exonuclease
MKKTVVVIDTKLVFYYQFHRRKHPFNCIQDVAAKIAEVLPTPPAKIIWAMDVGKSKRVQDYPAYKAHRAENDKKQSASEQKRKKNFEALYNNSGETLRYFGNVIAVPGYEADDIASIVASRFAGDSSINVVLISSDEDWLRFMYADNIKVLHYGTGKLLTRDSASEILGFPVDYKLHVDALTGVAKENVDGIIKAGKKRVSRILKDANYNLERLMYTLDEWCEEGKYGMRLPDWANSVRAVYERNYNILKPYTLSDFTSEETAQFREQWSSKKSENSTIISMEILEKFSFPILINGVMQRIFKITA